MAIVQISRITNRKGLIENLPQLAGAELGWAIDTRQLFIGNGTLEEGAPVIGNTEILTQFSDITALSNYTYKDIAVGYAAQTGPTSSDPIVRTVQAKLDDFADVRDFGAVGDGSADDTEAINRALYQLYCVETNTQIRRSLYFPAGTYRITESLIIPTYAKLVGEGADCTIIQLDTSSDISSLSAYVARYGDSLQQTGVNIGSNGATAPRNIEISSMTFGTVEITDVFLVENATQCYFDSVNFVGPLTTSSITADPASDDIAGVRFASTASLVCNQITFDKCRFAGLNYGINTDQEINSITVSNSKFEILYQGITLGTSTPVNGGATGFRAVHNMFDLVYAQGIVYDLVDLNVTAYNVFYDVGNNYTSNPVVAVIEFGNDNNASISDMFERSNDEANAVSRVLVTGASTTTGTQIQIGRYARENGRTQSLGNNQSNQTIFTTDTATIKAFQMTYTIQRDIAIRFGTLIVTAQNSDDSSLTLAYADDFTENIDTGITLAVSQSSNVITVKYSSTNTGLIGTLTYSLSYLS
jgi:hypothetical protein